MTITLNSEVLDVLMPYCRQNKVKPHDVIRKLILNQMGANEECQKQKNQNN